MPSSRIESRIADLLEDAREARDAGDWQTARSLLDAVTALDPGNAEAAAMLAGAATRRQMTLLFCDLVGSTELADQRDPEEVTAIIERYRSACAEVVAELDGYIDDHRGDGMLVLFGYPQVDEDDARRGVLCGLRMVERVRQAPDPRVSPTPGCTSASRCTPTWWSSPTASPARPPTRPPGSSSSPSRTRW